MKINAYSEEVITYEELYSLLDGLKLEAESAKKPVTVAIGYYRDLIEKKTYPTLEITTIDNDEVRATRKIAIIPNRGPRPIIIESPEPLETTHVGHMKAVYLAAEALGASHFFHYFVSRGLWSSEESD